MCQQLQHISTDYYSHRLIPQNDGQSSNLSRDQEQNFVILTLISLNKPIFVILQQPRQQKIIQNTNQQNQQKSPNFFKGKSMGYCRKEKSLEELSRKFIDYFEGKNNIILELDKVTQELGVERRRMYDIINILESLGIVIKCGKNKYRWKGLKQAIETIRKCQNQGNNFRIQGIRKQKSLQFLAGGFLNLFLHIKPAISLQYAIKQLIKNADELIVKTKIRRLYDIVNVFKSLGLVKKVILPTTKKPGFEWIGTSYIQKLIDEKKYFIKQLEEKSHSFGMNSGIVTNQQIDFIQNRCLPQQIKQIEASLKVQNQQYIPEVFMGFNRRLSAFSLVKHQ